MSLTKKQESSQLTSRFGGVVRVAVVLETRRYKIAAITHCFSMVSEGRGGHVMCSRVGVHRGIA